jgi:hypothetical protein
VTFALARKISWNVLRLEEAAAEVMTTHLAGRALPLEEGQGAMYREVRRARQFRRPLAVVSLTPTVESREASVNRLVQQILRETIHRYIDGRIADLLTKATNDCDVVAYTGRQFVLLLAESDRDQSEHLVRRIEAQAQQELGLALKCGIATFPDQEVTFSGLLERAEAEMHKSDFHEHVPSNGHPHPSEHVEAKARTAALEPVTA